MFKESMVNEVLLYLGQKLFILIVICAILFVIFKGLEMFVKAIVIEEIKKTLNKKEIVEFYKDGKLIGSTEVNDGVVKLKKNLEVGEYVIKRY
ncbi:MAG: hypothetical protein NSGCLCUN01_02841 [uncultured Clostridium sp.]